MVQNEYWSLFRQRQFPDLIDEIYKPILKQSQHATLVPELYLARFCADSGVEGGAQAQGRIRIISFGSIEGRPILG
jgi:hypothetical protein